MTYSQTSKGYTLDYAERFRQLGESPQNIQQDASDFLAGPGAWGLMEGKQKPPTNERTAFISTGISAGKPMAVAHGILAKQWQPQQSNSYLVNSIPSLERPQSLCPNQRLTVGLENLMDKPPLNQRRLSTLRFLLDSGLSAHLVSDRCFLQFRV